MNQYGQGPQGPNPVQQNLEGIYIQAEQRAQARTREIDNLRQALSALSQSMLERLSLLEVERNKDVEIMNQARLALQGQPVPSRQAQQVQQPQQQRGQQPLSENKNLTPQDVANLVGGQQQTGPNGGAKG